MEQNAYIYRTLIAYNKTMKNYLRIAFCAIVSLSLFSCSNTEELETRLDDIESRLSAVEQLVRNANNGDLITSVSAVYDENNNVIGYRLEFQKGSPVMVYFGKDGTDGKDGNDGRDGEPLIASIHITDGYVVFILTDGQSFRIPLLQALELELEFSDGLVMIPNQRLQMHYTVKSSFDDISVEAFTSANVKAKVIPDAGDPHNGLVEIATGAEIDYEFDKVVLLVTDGKAVIIRRLEFSDSGIGVYDDSQKVVGSGEGEISLDYVTDDVADVEVPADASSWIEVVSETKSLHKASVVIRIKANEGYSRSADIIITTWNGLTIVFHIEQCANIEFVEKEEDEVLADIYDSLNGDSWKFPINITRDPITGRITELEFLQWDLKGAIPESIGNLTGLKRLEFLTLSTDAIPESIGRLTELEYLKIGSIAGSGNITRLPDGLFNCTKLRELSIINNRISEFPNKITRLRNLEVLNFNCNPVSGEIPSDIGELKHLRYFDIYDSGAKLTGSLPESFGNLKELEKLTLWAPGYKVSLKNICSLTNLKDLLLMDDAINEPFPKEFGRLKKLRSIQLDNTGITGPLPDVFYGFDDLETMCISWNQLGGTIPHSIGTNQKLVTFQVINCGLTGSIPANLAHVSNLWLQENNFSGPLPDDFYETDWWRNRWGIFVTGNPDIQVRDYRTYYGPDFSLPDKPWGKPTINLAEEYSKSPCTLLFQWWSECAYNGGAMDLVEELYARYRDKGLRVISWSDPSTASQEEEYTQRPGFKWTNYYYALCYPGWVAPTLTLVGADGKLLFSDMIDPREDIESVISSVLK